MYLSYLASDNVETAFAVAAVDEQPNFHGLLPLLFNHITDDLLYPLFYFNTFGLFKASNPKKKVKLDDRGTWTLSMPPRPALKVKQNRPISAIYLGKDANSHALQSTSSSHTEATSPRLPDLPEPPSPSSSIGSVQSGLPSPPATNSTGSGSTGDPATITFRERSLSHQSNSSNSTSSGTASTPMKSSLNGSEAEYDDYDKENGNDNDNDNNDDTARLNENVMALQRVKSLAERNRMVSHFYL